MYPEHSFLPTYLDIRCDEQLEITYLNSYLSHLLLYFRHFLYYIIIFILVDAKRL